MDQPFNYRGTTVSLAVGQVTDRVALDIANPGSLRVVNSGAAVIFIAFGDVDRYGEGFDHNQLAFPLEGEHANVQCAACHPAAGSMANLQTASQECAACHQDDDPHQGDLGSECQACHTPLDWEQVNFHHALAAATSTCIACHESDDPHRGEFGQECSACHSTRSWLPAEFHHAQSQFPLTGAHLAVRCSECHQDGVYEGTPTQCSACHAEREYHRGAFGVECDACHTTGAWSRLPGIRRGHRLRAQR